MLRTHDDDDVIFQTETEEEDNEKLTIPNNSVIGLIYTNTRTNRTYVQVTSVMKDGKWTREYTWEEAICHFTGLVHDYLRPRLLIMQQPDKSLMGREVLDYAKDHIWVDYDPLASLPYEVAAARPTSKQNYKTTRSRKSNPKTSPYKQSDNTSNDYEYAYVDSASDTSGIGGKAWIIDSISDRQVSVEGYEKGSTVLEGIRIGSAITAVDLPNEETILLRVNEATILGEQGNSLLSTTQIREYGITIDDRPRMHGGKSCMVVEGKVIPFTMKRSMVTLKIRRPTEEELEQSEVIDITSVTEWLPETINEQEFLDCTLSRC